MTSERDFSERDGRYSRREYSRDERSPASHRRDGHRADLDTTRHSDEDDFDSTDSTRYSRRDNSNSTRYSRRARSRSPSAYSYEGYNYRKRDEIDYNQPPRRPVLRQYQEVSRELYISSLPLDTTENDILSAIARFCPLDNVEEIRVIRRAGVLSHFGFITLRDEDAASELLCQCSGILAIKTAAHSDKATLRYAQDRRGSRRNSGVGIQANPPTPKGPSAKDKGTFDVSNAPSQILIVQDLPSRTTVGDLAAGVFSLTGSENIYRVFLARRQGSGEILNYGLIEFFYVFDAQITLTKSQELPEFRILSHPVKINYAGGHIFRPRDATDIAENPVFTAPHNPAQKLSYHIRDVLLEERVISAEPPLASRSCRSSSGMDKSDVMSLVSEGKEKDPKSRKRKTGASEIAARKMKALPIARWARSQAELHGEDAKKEETSEASQPPSYLSYLDFSTLTCTLCKRQLKSTEALERHEKASKLHKNNLIAKGQESSAAAKTSAAPAISAEEQPENSSRADIMAKHGWTEGSALGAEGTGILAAVHAEKYAEGVGLGMEGGELGDAAEEAEKNTKFSFPMKAKEALRKPFNELE